jgi:hypothetical protein
MVGGCGDDSGEPSSGGAGAGGAAGSNAKAGSSPNPSAGTKAGAGDGSMAGGSVEAGTGNVPETGGSGQGGDGPSPGGALGVAGNPDMGGAGGAAELAPQLTWLGPCAPLGLSNDGKTVLAEQGVWRSETGWVAPPELEGGEVQSSVRALSANGNVAFGSSSSQLGGELYRWTIGGAVEPLGVTDMPLATNLDGTVLLALRAEADYGAPVRWTSGGGFATLDFTDPVDADWFSFAPMEAYLSEAGDLAYMTQHRDVFRWTPATGAALQYAPGGHNRVTSLTGDGRKPAVVTLIGDWASIEATGTCLLGGPYLAYMAPPDSCPDQEVTLINTDYDATGKRSVGVQYEGGDAHDQYYFSEARGMRKLKDVLPLDANIKPAPSLSGDAELTDVRHGPFLSADGLTVLSQATNGECFLASVEDRPGLNPEVYKHDPDGAGGAPAVEDFGPLEWLGFCSPTGISDNGKTLLSTNGWWTEDHGWWGFPENPDDISNLEQFPSVVSGDGQVIYGQLWTGTYRWTAATAMQVLGAYGGPLATSFDGSVMVGIKGGLPFVYTTSGGFQALTAQGGPGALTWNQTGPYRAQLTPSGDLAYFSSAGSYASWHAGDTTFKVLSTSKIATALSGDGQVLKLINATGSDVTSTGSCLEASCTNSRVALLGLDTSGTRGVGNEWVNEVLVHSFYWTQQGGMQELDVVVPQGLGIDVYPGDWIDLWDNDIYGDSSASPVRPQLSRDGKYLFARDENGVCFRLALP